MTHIPGFTSTGSKRPEALFSEGEGAHPRRMVRSAGCRFWDDRGREYVDYVMGLGSVALGYGHPKVGRAAVEAIEAGVVGPLPPVLEEELARELCRQIPGVEQVRFLKTGAEAMGAAVRLARAATGREYVLGCGYHGWLDWCRPTDPAVPAGTRALYGEMPFNDPERSRALIRGAAGRLAAVIFEPIVDQAPDPTWLAVLREEASRVGAVLVCDEIKTVCRLAVGGAAERYGIRPDLIVIGKAIANGFPLAAVGGRAEIMGGATRTWISSTLATEAVSLAAAKATLGVMVEEAVPAHLTRIGARLFTGLTALAQRHPGVVAGVGGIPEMCFLRYREEPTSGRIARACADRGLLFKRSAYNFVSLAHDEAVVDHTLGVLEDALGSAG